MMLRLCCVKSYANKCPKYFSTDYSPNMCLVKKLYSSGTNNKSNQDTEVYHGNLTSQIRAVKLFSLVSSGMGIAAQPILYEQSTSLGAPITVALFGFVGFFTFVTPFLLHSITKKYVTHLYFNSDTGKYSATILNFFLREKKVTFSTEDVIVPDVPGMFTSFQVKGIGLFVDPRLFGEPKHYAKIMGYDKPIDFKLGKASEKPNASKSDT